MEWIQLCASEVRRQRFRPLILLVGDLDVLNTREHVSVRALSSAMAFFDRMATVLDVPIHILLGNHDMNLKHSSRVSSLDALSTRSMLKGGRFHLHRDVVQTSVAGIAAVMIPYHENAESIVTALESLRPPNSAVAFGHLAVNGAIQNSSSSYRFRGALEAEVFSGLKRTFSGHFHTHQTLAHSTVPPNLLPCYLLCFL